MVSRTLPLRVCAPGEESPGVVEPEPPGVDDDPPDGSPPGPQVEVDPDEEPDGEAEPPVVELPEGEPVDEDPDGELVEGDPDGLEVDDDPDGFDVDDEPDGDPVDDEPEGLELELLGFELVDDFAGLGDEDPPVVALPDGELEVVDDPEGLDVEEDPDGDPVDDEPDGPAVEPLGELDGEALALDAAADGDDEPGITQPALKIDSPSGQLRPG